VEGDASDDLDVEGDHVPDEFVVADRYCPAAEPAAGVLDCGEGLAKNVVEGFALLDSLLELLGLGPELLVAKALVRDFELVYAVYERTHLLHVAFGFAAEQSFENPSEHLYLLAY